MEQPTRPRRHQARTRHQPFPARPAPGPEANAGAAFTTLPVTRSGAGQGSAVAATPPASPALPVSTGPKVAEWGWGKHIAVGVIRHEATGLWQSWLSVDGALVRSLTAHREYWPAHQVASLYAESYGTGRLLGLSPHHLATFEQTLLTDAIPAPLTEKELIMIGTLIKTAPFPGQESVNGAGNPASFGGNGRSAGGIVMEQAGNNALALEKIRLQVGEAVKP